MAFEDHTLYIKEIQIVHNRQLKIDYKNNIERETQLKKNTPLDY